jgi:hypothetical protein
MKKYADTIIPRCKASSHDANRLIWRKSGKF